MKKFLMATALFCSLSDICLAKEVGTASFRIERKSMPGAIKASGAKVDGDYKLDANTVSGKFSVKLNTFDAGMELLTNHVCEKLECTLYPEAVFSLDPFLLKDGEIKGTLSLHGKSVSMIGWKAEVDGKKVTVKGIVALRDFGIEPPEYAGIGVQDKAEVNVEITI